jgi:hypothetical protein
MVIERSDREFGQLDFRKELFEKPLLLAIEDNVRNPFYPAYLGWTFFRKTAGHHQRSARVFSCQMANLVAAATICRSRHSARIDNANVSMRAFPHIGKAYLPQLIGISLRLILVRTAP